MRSRDARPVIPQNANDLRFQIPRLHFKDVVSSYTHRQMQLKYSTRTLYPSTGILCTLSKRLLMNLNGRNSPLTRRRCPTLAYDGSEGEISGLRLCQGRGSRLPEFVLMPWSICSSLVNSVSIGYKAVTPGCAYGVVRVGSE